MRRKIIFWICFVILLAAVGTGAGLLIRNHIQAQKDEELRKKGRSKDRDHRRSVGRRRDCAVADSGRF